jgi:copper chaperone NosL
MPFCCRLQNKYPEKNMKQLGTASRITIGTVSLLLCAVYFLPVWRIDLFAPQYPEGLYMNIWLNRLSGNVDIINGLNHYIGMEEINAASFPEFTYLVYIVGFFIALGLVIAITGKTRLLLLYLSLSVIGGALAVIDFYRWGYAYGHNLNPNAPIKVPGLTYQPPIIGHKRLLNFDAYSFPDTGGWLVIGVVGAAFAVFFFEWLKHRKRHAKKLAPAVATLAMLLVFSACKPKAVPIEYGKDNCTTCKMGISDNRYGCELVTGKGKAFKFDDIQCMVQYMKADAEPVKTFKLRLAADFAGKGDLIDIEKAWLVVCEEIKSPMGSHIMAFENEAAGKTALNGFTYTPVSWQTVYEKIK